MITGYVVYNKKEVPKDKASIYCSYPWPFYVVLDVKDYDKEFPGPKNRSEKCN